jgi:hypothetical protein
MKRSIITGVLLLGVASVLAQGTINYNNRQSDVDARVYGPLGPGDMTAITGQSPIGIPPGTTDYGGRPFLAGAGYYAELWAGPANSPEGSLAPVPGTLTTFRTGAFAGYFVPSPLAIPIPGVPPGSVATLQLRVWENLGGTVSDWATAEARWLNGLLAAGKSPLFQSLPLGGGIMLPPNLVGLQSFNIYYIPEPGTLALLGLGALGLMIFRRK